jgi:hypothetical protein
MLENHIARLKEKHSDLEKQIRDEDLRPKPDYEKLHSLKVKKLHLKEELEEQF